jgi:hypothetical protein
MCFDKKYTVPEPVLFNPFKHHAGFIHDFIIKKVTTGTVYDQKALKTDLNIIGKSQMDLYTGSIPPFEIAEEIRKFLTNNRSFKESDYLTWIRQAGASFRTFTLTDGSLWVLLPGEIPGRWVHIHPGRHSPLTVRVRAETMKTAIAVIYHCTRYGLDCYDLSIINIVRTGLLDLSPMKEVSVEKGTGKIIGILLKY